MLIWQIFRKHQNIPDDISDLHLHIDNFKVNIQKEFNFLKETDIDGGLPIKEHEETQGSDSFIQHLLGESE